MRPFPPIDGPEIAHAHAMIKERVLRALPIEVELGLPVLLAQGRQGSGNEVPFSDREAGFRQSGGAADQHHGEDEKNQDEQPTAHKPRALPDPLRASDLNRHSDHRP
jgi:hypothetical protein